MEQRCYMCRRTRGEILSDMKTYSDFDEKSAEFLEDKGLEDCFTIEVRPQIAFFVKKEKNAAVKIGNGLTYNSKTFAVHVPLCSICAGIIEQSILRDSRNSV